MRKKGKRAQKRRRSSDDDDDDDYEERKAPARHRQRSGRYPKRGGYPAHDPEQNPWHTTINCCNTVYDLDQFVSHNSQVHLGAPATANAMPSIALAMTAANAASWFTIRNHPHVEASAESVVGLSSISRHQNGLGQSHSEDVSNGIIVYPSSSCVDSLEWTCLLFEDLVENDGKTGLIERVFAKPLHSEMKEAPGLAQSATTPTPAISPLSPSFDSTKTSTAATESKNLKRNVDTSSQPEVKSSVSQKEADSKLIPNESATAQFKGQLRRMRGSFRLRGRVRAGKPSRLAVSMANSERMQESGYSRDSNEEVKSISTDTNCPITPPLTAPGTPKSLLSSAGNITRPTSTSPKTPSHNGLFPTEVQISSPAADLVLRILDSSVSPHPPSPIKWEKHQRMLIGEFDGDVDFEDEIYSGGRGSLPTDLRPQPRPQQQDQGPQLEQPLHQHQSQSQQQVKQESENKLEPEEAVSQDMGIMAISSTVAADSSFSKRRPFSPPSLRPVPGTAAYARAMLKQQNSENQLNSDGVHLRSPVTSTLPSHQQTQFQPDQQNQDPQLYGFSQVGTCSHPLVPISSQITAAPSSESLLQFHYQYPQHPHSQAYYSIVLSRGPFCDISCLGAGIHGLNTSGFAANGDSAGAIVSDVVHIASPSTFSALNVNLSDEQSSLISAVIGGQVAEVVEEDVDARVIDALFDSFVASPSKAIRASCLIST
ncbi:hypothetical protein HDU76_004507 [Blyttiomyces sp. JEL0837]|nr:hypothetical protein HDU76_004507 [Blyttiomyces sp. JEL0837]